MSEAVLQAETCEKCGADVREGTSFCYNCGAPVVEAALAPPPEPTVEPNDAQLEAQDDEAKPDLVEKATRERKKARGVKPKSVDYMWEPVAVDHRALVAAVTITVVVTGIVIIMVFWK